MAIEEYYIRDRAPPANADLRFYDLATTTVAVGSNPTSSQIGDLWLTFEVEYYQPKVSPDADHNDAISVWLNTASGSFANIEHPLGNTPSIDSNHLPATFTLSPSGSEDTVTLTSAVLGERYLTNFNSFGGTGAAITGSGCVVECVDGSMTLLNTLGSSNGGTGTTAYSETQSWLVIKTPPVFKISTNNKNPPWGATAVSNLLVTRLPQPLAVEPLVSVQTPKTLKFQAPTEESSSEDEDSEEEMVTRSEMQEMFRSMMAEMKRLQKSSSTVGG